ncbi:hypothetical protein PT276_06555 [Orbaceae bacterium ESL0721]|nr:hypothetical protein [Orbaceae bacterium ESL0721]
MRNKPELQKHYGKEELRMFTYYTQPLLLLAGTFRARTTQLWQSGLLEKNAKSVMMHQGDV